MRMTIVAFVKKFHNSPIFDKPHMRADFAGKVLTAAMQMCRRASAARHAAGRLRR
jgi:hypothetical protein